MIYNVLTLFGLMPSTPKRVLQSFYEYELTNFHQPDLLGPDVIDNGVTNSFFDF